VGALLKPPHLHLHQTSTNFKIPLHNISHDVQPCPYTQQIKKKRKEKDVETSAGAHGELPV